MFSHNACVREDGDSVFLRHFDIYQPVVPTKKAYKIKARMIILKNTCITITRTVETEQACVLK